MDALAEFIEKLSQSLSDQSFAKVTLSKPYSRSSTLINVYMRPVVNESTLRISSVEHYSDKDLTKIIDTDDIKEHILGYLPSQFKKAHLMTNQKTYTLQFNRRRIGRITKGAAQTQLSSSKDHNRNKEYLIPESATFLRKLDISNEKGVKPSRYDKFRQINKYVEIMSSLLKKADYISSDRIVDMGCGKGYLTFGLYDYLMRKMTKPHITGVDLKDTVIDQINQHSNDLGFDTLSFIHGDIAEYTNVIDVIIALHACDTATDIAISKGIQSNAKLIVVAPCCHKQIRKSISKYSSFEGILQNGILLERHAELITDTIRTWLLEAHGYKTRVFEFISNEHTAKNLMIAAYKLNTKEIDPANTKKWLGKIERLKKEYGIDVHYLELLLT